MVEAFNRRFETLGLAVQDVISPSTNAAYITFFKNPSHASYWREILMNALSGISIQSGVPGNPPASPKAVFLQSSGQLEILRGKW